MWVARGGLLLITLLTPLEIKRARSTHIPFWINPQRKEKKGKDEKRPLLKISKAKCEKKIRHDGIKPSTSSIQGNLGGAGNRTQIETGQHEYPRGFPQRHVLPLHHTTVCLDAWSVCSVCGRFFLILIYAHAAFRAPKLVFSRFWVSAHDQLAKVTVRDLLYHSRKRIFGLHVLRITVPQSPSWHFWILTAARVAEWLPVRVQTRTFLRISIPSLLFSFLAEISSAAVKTFAWCFGLLP